MAEAAVLDRCGAGRGVGGGEMIPAELTAIGVIAIAVFGLIALVYGAGVMVDRWFGWWGR
jgi:hypothetical protein